MKATRLKFSILLVLFTVSVGFYSCKDDPDDDIVTTALSTRDRNFAHQASFSNNAEIELGRLAVDKSENDSIHAFAQRMIDDHTLAEDQLDSIADIWNIELTNSLDTAHMDLRTLLSGLEGVAFDSAYIHNQVIDHQNTLDLLQDQIDNGSDSSFVQYARRQLPVVRMHHERALELRNEFNNGEEDDPLDY